MVWRLMWQVTMWFTPPRALNRYQAVAAALAAHWRGQAPPPRRGTPGAVAPPWPRRSHAR